MIMKIKILIYSKWMADKSCKLEKTRLKGTLITVFVYWISDYKEVADQLFSMSAEEKLSGKSLN